jgi:hypothetical protein
MSYDGKFSVELETQTCFGKNEKDEVSVSKSRKVSVSLSVSVVVEEIEGEVSILAFSFGCLVNGFFIGLSVGNIGWQS